MVSNVAETFASLILEDEEKKSWTQELNDSTFDLPPDLTTYNIPGFSSSKHAFVPINKNVFETEDVRSELLQDYRSRMDNLQLLRWQSDRRWTCECDSMVGSGADRLQTKLEPKLLCTDMNCRNLAANLSCPPQCGRKSGATCWNQHFQDPFVTFAVPDGLLLFESESIGLGVLTTKRMRKGSVTGEFVGVVSKGCTGTDDDIYAAQVAELEYHITPIEKGNYTRFYNHCGVDPNHDALCFLTAAGPRILMVASKDIEPGQECTWDYGSYWDKAFLEMGNGKCLCKNCSWPS